MKLLILLLFAASMACRADEHVIRVSPGSPKETFLIGATAKKVGDSIAFEISISPRTTKPTFPFDCLVTTQAGSIGWHIGAPCFNQRKKKADEEIVRISIPESQVDGAVFEFRFYLATVENTEIWRIQLKDYKNGAEPE